MNVELEGLIRPTIGVELEHLAKSTPGVGWRDAQVSGVEAAIKAANQYVYPNHTPAPTHGISPAWNYYGASPDLCCLPSGGACYDDLSQVEVCTPCTLAPADAYRHMSAQEYVVARAIAEHAEDPVYLWLMNRSRKPHGRGFVYRAGHVNIAMSRVDLTLMTEEAFGQTLRAYVPFMIAAGVLLGSGAVGDENSDEVFLCSQRLEGASTIFPTAATTTNRTLSLNLRGFAESLSEDAAAIRNHVIGPQDLTLSPTSELRIALIQAATYALLRAHPPVPYADLSLARPMEAAFAWNRDPWEPQLLETGEQVTAMDMADRGCETIAAILAEDPYAATAIPDWDKYAAWLARVTSALRDHDLKGSGVEWAAKRIAFADTAEPEDAVNLDILWHEVTPELFAEEGLHIARDCGHAPPFTTEALEQTFITPPEDTRAYLRGHIVQRCIETGETVMMTNWDGLNLKDRRLRVDLPQPEACSKADLGPLLDQILVAAQPYTESLTYQHRSRVQHHSLGTQMVQTIGPTHY